MHRLLGIVCLGTVVGAAPASRAGMHEISPQQTPEQIRAVMRSAGPGDTVTVAPGDYASLRVPSGIVLQAATGPSQTTVSGTGDFVLDLRGTDSTTVVDGLTVAGGRTAAALIRADSSRAVIRNCVLRGGWSGIRAVGSDLRVENCLIGECQNGVFLDEGTGVLTGNEIRRCTRGVNLVDAGPSLRGNDIRENSVGLAAAGRSDPEIGESVEHANTFRDNRTAVLNTTATASGALAARRP
ncbi:MAG: hypothetical protein HKN12_05675, partial [Gemmatimonadetes bacterium]|nr:hypothetical protein [Gemmatimonadota bacterium]